MHVNENISQTGGVLAIIHTIGHIINFYILSRQPMEVLSCLLPSTFRKNGRDDQPSFSFFIFQTLQGITGTVRSKLRVDVETIISLTIFERRYDYNRYVRYLCFRFTTITSTTT